jgi:hypothetical protein
MRDATPENSQTAKAAVCATYRLIINIDSHILSI